MEKSSPPDLNPAQCTLHTVFSQDFPMPVKLTETFPSKMKSVSNTKVKDFTLKHCEVGSVLVHKGTLRVALSYTRIPTHFCSW